MSLSQSATATQPRPVSKESSYKASHGTATLPAAMTAQTDAEATQYGFSLYDPTLHAIQFLQRAPGELTTEPVNPSTSPPGAHFFFGLQGVCLQLRMMLACVMMALALGIAFH